MTTLLGIDGERSKSNESRLNSLAAFVVNRGDMSRGLLSTGQERTQYQEGIDYVEDKDGDDHKTRNRAAGYTSVAYRAKPI